MKRTAVLAIAIIISSVFFMQCHNDNTSPTQPPGGGSGKAVMELRIVDAPALYDSVIIVFDSVRIHRDTSDTLSGWSTLSRTQTSYNLLRLVAGASALLGRDSILAGRYTQIRLYIDSLSHVVVGGVSHFLEVPSGSQSGLKINIDTTVQSDVGYIITLDFDANRSIVRTGSPSAPRYLLKPVIRAVLTATGSISGRVSPSAANPIVLAYSGADSASTFADTAGGFRLSGLAPKAYTVLISPQNTLYADTTIANVLVRAGADTSLGTMTLRLR